MPRSSGGRLLAEIGVGGHGRRNIVNDENQNWWCPTIKQPPPATITSTIQPAFQQSRNQVIDYPSLSTLLQENVFCRTCVSTFVDEYSKQTVRAFVTYLQNNSAYHITMEEKCDSFLEQALLEKSVMQPLIVVSSETYGLASAVKITCLTCQKQVAKLESARSCNNEDEDHGEIKKKEAKQFAINQQFILGCHEAGLGPGDADIVCSAMNLPLAVGFWSTQGNFTAVEDVVGEVAVTTAALTMEEFCWEEEIFQTLNVHERGDWADKGQDFDWWNTLSGTERLSVLNNHDSPSASYNMGWQQQSSGNKYSSVSGHAFCISG